jgi:hypothetical protein
MAQIYAKGNGPSTLEKHGLGQASKTMQRFAEAEVEFAECGANLCVLRAHFPTLISDHV